MTPKDQVTTNEIMEFLQDNMVTKDEFELRVGGLETRMNEFERRMDRVEGIIERTFNKLDEFLVMIGRHEAEIAALRSAVSRLEVKVEQLEAGRV